MHEIIQSAAPDAAADPALFARRVLRLEPTGQQAEFFRELAKPGARVAVRSGHGTGKSTALAAAALWFLSTRTDALVPCTAPTAHQLRDVLWREMRRLVHGMDEDIRPLFSLTSDRVTMAGSAGMIVARTARTDNPDALQGFHAPEILFVIDEAAGVHDAIFEVARGALSTASARVALAGNPTRLSGYFHTAFHAAKESWARLFFSCLDSPLVAPGYARDMAAEYGADSDVYRVRVLGEFPRAAVNSLIDPEWVDRAMAAEAPPDYQEHEPVVFGVDPAWRGGDRSVVAMRRGRTGRILYATRGEDTVLLAAKVTDLADRRRPRTIFVDQTGVGAGVYDLLLRTGHNVVGVAFAGKALDPRRFFNRRAEIWWKMREWLRVGAVLQPGPELRDDLIGPEYYLTDGGKIQLESKPAMQKRGVPSPDCGDALALTFAMEVEAPRPAPPPARAVSPYHVYEWMERN